MARRPIARLVLIGGVLVAVALAVLAVMLPRIVKQRIIAAAAAQGVALGVDDLSLAPGRARLRGVRATPLVRSDAKGAPTASAEADVVDVALDGLTPTAVTVTGLRLKLDGSLAALRALLAPKAQGAATASPLASVTLKDASLAWLNALPTSRVAIEALHVDGDVARKPGRSLGDDWHFETKDLRMFGGKDEKPWGAAADGDAKGLRASLVLPSPPSSGGAASKSPRVSIAVAPNGARTLDVDTPDVVAADLGVPPSMLGLLGDETSHFELHLHHHEADAAHADGTIVLDARDVYLGPSTQRTSFSLDARYAGDPRSSLTISQGTLRAGPFTGALTGSFALDPASGLRADLHYASGMMSCVDAVRAQAASYGSLGKGVAALAGMLGLDRAVEGRILLRGDIVIAPPAPSHVSFHTEGDCKLSYLPSM